MSIAAGFQSGIALGRAFNEGRERRRLEGIRTAAPEMSQGYTAEQGQQLEAMASAINPETGRPYYNVQAGQGGNYTVTPDFTEAQTPKAMGADSQYGVANVELQPAGLGRAGVVAQPIPFNQQRVTDFLGRRFEGELTPDRIEALRSRAMAEGISDPRLRQAALAEATRAEREAEEAPLRRQALETQVAAGKLGLTKTEQDIESGTLTLEQQKRAAAELQRASEFNAFVAENPNLTTAELKDAAFKQFKFTPKQWQDAVNTRLGISDTEQKLFVSGIKDKLKGKNLQQIGSLYNTDPDFDDKTDLAIVPGKGGAVTLNFIDKASGRVTSTQSFKSEALATEYLNKQATEPENIGSWMLALQKTQSGIDAQQAQIRASDAAVGLRNQQMQMLRTQAAGNAEAQAVRADYEALTPEEQVGPKGQGLIRQFNMANAKAGTPIPLGPAPRAERPALSEADKTARAKAMVEARDIDPNTGKKFTLNGAIKFLEGGSRDQIGEALDKALGGSDPFAPTTSTARPTAAPTGLQTQPARNAPVEPNPYVDARGRPLAVTPAGSPSLASTAIPAAASAVENAVGTQAAATRYLQAKIARNEPLSPTERARAQQMGLIR